jgi:hypothetical protein
MATNDRAMCGIHEQQLAEIDVKIDRVLALLDGGPGEPGLRMRVDRIEQSHVTSGKAFWLALTTALGLIGTLVSRLWEG